MRSYPPIQSLTPEYTVEPILGWKAANAHPRGPTRPIGQAAPENEPFLPLTGQACTDIVIRIISNGHKEGKMCCDLRLIQRQVKAIN